MVPLTQLERSILDAICMRERRSFPKLREVLSTAVVSNRENTGYGFYTTLHLTAIDVIPCFQFDGPYVRMLDMGDDAAMGFMLWCSEQGPRTLEGWQIGEEGNLVDLHTFDLETLRFSAILW